jgi:hypothetical protein
VQEALNELRDKIKRKDAEAAPTTPKRRWKDTREDAGGSLGQQFEIAFQAANAPSDAHALYAQYITDDKPDVVDAGKKTSRRNYLPRS